MQADDEGFLYPHVDGDACIGCKRCEKACPALSPLEDHRPLKTFAAMHTQLEIRRESSSGGVFTLLAEQVLAKGGIVFAARFDDQWQVVHAKAEKSEDLHYFRGSKYVQSKIGTCYAEALDCLKQGRKVMFVGTPCQIAGLHQFIAQRSNPRAEHLEKPYDLLTVDFICHGVPSPAVWQWYVDRQAASIARKTLAGRFFYWRDKRSFVRQVEFRNKANGWKQFGMVFKTKGATYSQIHRQDAYMKAFLDNYSLRPSCYQCKIKYGRSHSDITLADFWNVHRVTDQFDDDQGTSLVLVNTSKGLEHFEPLPCRKKEVAFDDAIQYNQAWAVPYAMNPNRDTFFQHYRDRLDDIVTQPKP